MKKIKDNSFNKFNLSDVFEAMSKNDSNIVFQEILRTGKNNSKLFWNNLIKRDIPPNLQSNFIRDKEKKRNYQYLKNSNIMRNLHMYN